MHRRLTSRRLRDQAPAAIRLPTSPSRASTRPPSTESDDATARPRRTMPPGRRPSRSREWPPPRLRQAGLTSRRIYANVTFHTRQQARLHTREGDAGAGRAFPPARVERVAVRAAALRGG